LIKNKTWIRAYFPMKTSAKHFGLEVGPGNINQNDPKTTSLMMSLTKELQPPNQKLFSSAIY